MARKRASMREGPLAELFRATEAAQKAEQERAGEPGQPEERTVEHVPTWEESVENVAEDLLSLDGMDTETAGLLAEKGVTTRDALADLAVDELTELTGLASDRAQDLIMKARAHWFEDENIESAESANQGH